MANKKKKKTYHIRQDHHIEDHQFDTFYVEDLKEFQGKRDRKRKTSYNQSEITNVYSDNNEGLSDRMPSEQSEED